MRTTSHGEQIHALRLAMVDDKTQAEDALKRNAELPIKPIWYDMRGFMSQVVEKYLEQFGKKHAHLNHVSLENTQHRGPPNPTG